MDQLTNGYLYRITIETPIQNIPPELIYSKKDYNHLQILPVQLSVSFYPPDHI